ncbi:hypothetical protein Q6316_29995, partial [Klebsiella pneumoniae]|nr:hypothetical protein [Klebsiella pneumoniae]
FYIKRAACVPFTRIILLYYQLFLLIASIIFTFYRPYRDFFTFLARSANIGAFSNPTMAVFCAQVNNYFYFSRFFLLFS